MPTIVALYRADDTKAIIGRLDDFLTNRFGEKNVRIGVDTLVQPGEDYLDSIENGLKTTDVLLVVIGTQWLTSSDGTWLTDSENRDQIALAAALRDKRRVMPVLVNGATLPTADQLPEALKSLARRSPIQLREDTFRADATQLAESIEKAVPAAAAPVAPKPAPAYPKTQLDPNFVPRSLQSESEFKYTTPPTSPRSEPPLTSQSYGGQSGYGGQAYGGGAGYAPPYAARSGMPTSGSGMATGSYELAGIGARFAALFIDGLIIGVVVFVISLIVQSAMVGSASNYYDDYEYIHALTNASLVTNCLTIILSLTYYTLTLAGNGQTPGKRAMNIRVVCADGSPMTTGVAFKRALGYLVSGIVIGIGYLVAFGDPYRRTWHDRIAGTIVIKA